MFPFACRPWIPVISLLLLGVPVWAQSDAPDGYKSGSHSLETVTVIATRHPTAVKDLAESVAVLSETELQLIQSVHISEALNRVPGVWIHRGSGQESLTAIRSPVLTGSGSCGAFAVVQDGVPVRGSGFCNVNELFDLNTEQAARVEVLRGPGTALYGSDAQHGVINVVSRAPVQKLDALALEAGANHYGRIKVDHSRIIGEESYRINFNAARDGGYKMDSGFEQQKFNARFDTQRQMYATRSLVSFSNLHQETAGYLSGKNAYKDPQRKRENENPEAFRDSRSLRAHTQVVWQTRSGDQVLLTPYVRATDMAFLMHFLPGTPLEENGQLGGGIQSLYRVNLNDRFAVQTGLDLELTEAWLTQTQALGFSSFPAGKQYDYEVKASLAAVFAQAEWDVTESTFIGAGARFEYLNYDYHNKLLSGNTAADGSLCVNGFTGAVGCRYTRPRDSTDAFSNVSVNGSVVHDFNPHLSAMVRLAKAFRAPQATEMYRLQNGQMQADLDSESIESIEVGSRFEHTAVALSLTAFYMEKGNVIFESSDRLNLSGGETQHAGLEYELSWDVQTAWRLGVAGTFARHTYTNDVTAPGSSNLIATTGNDMDTAPRQLHNAFLNWMPTDLSRVELQWQFIGHYFTDIENVHEYAGHALFNVKYHQQLTDRMAIGVRVNNLTNAAYAERADYSSLGGGDRYFVGEPRSLYADIQIAL